MIERKLGEIRKRGEIYLDNFNDPVTVFVKELEESIDKLSEPLSWMMSHNRRRSVHGMAIAREQRQHQLRSTQDVLNILKNEEFEEITFHKNEDGKVIGFTIKP